MSETIETNNPALPSYECEAYKKQLPALQITRDLCGGTLELRQKGEAYLPKEPKEEPGPYEYRRKRAILFNMYERGKAALVGMVFNGEMELEEDVPEIMRGREAEAETDEVEGQLEDCDRNGTHLSVFAKEFFDNAIDDGHCFLYVDMPPKLPDGATAEDEQRANRRPYFVKYRKDQAVNWRVDARGTLQQITFRECTWEPVGAFGEEEVTRYRVLTPGRWQLFRVVKDERGKMTVVPDPDTPEGETSLDYIPVSVCYTRKMGILHSKPMLLDAALVNVAWWQKYSDYSIYLHINSRPLLWFRHGFLLRPEIRLHEHGRLGPARLAGSRADVAAGLTERPPQRHRAPILPLDADAAIDARCRQVRVDAEPVLDLVAQFATGTAGISEIAS
jgi:hypothetical protein